MVINVESTFQQTVFIISAAVNPLAKAQDAEYALTVCAFGLDEFEETAFALVIDSTNHPAMVDLATARNGF